MAGAASAVAPELTPELKAIATARDLHIEFASPAHETAAVDTPSGKISFDLGFAEALWALSYSFVVFPDMYQRGGELRVTKGRGRAAARLFDRAKNILLGRYQDWPCCLPTPRMICFKSVRSANELFLAAVGWVLLHEIGHVKLGHVTQEPGNEERADAFASSWMLGWDPAEDIPAQNYWKRCAGTTLVLIQNAGPEFFNRTRGGTTHPDPVDRLRGFLRRYVDEYAGLENEQKDQLWSAVAVILYLFLIASKRHGELPTNIEPRALVDLMLQSL